MLRLSHRCLINTLSGVILSTCLMLSGCSQSDNGTGLPFTSNPVSQESLNLVNQAFRSHFIGGDWFYQGAQDVDGNIKAYIQIPEKLDMSLENQRNYLRLAICPSAKFAQMWQTLENRTLSVHIYSVHKSMTVYADCKNPLLS